MVEYAAPKTDLMHNRLDQPSVALVRRYEPASLPPSVLMPSDKMDLAKHCMFKAELSGAASLKWQATPASPWTQSGCRLITIHTAPTTTVQAEARVEELRERLLDLVSCAGRPKVWEQIADEVAQVANRELLRTFVLDEGASWNVRALAARMYARVVDERPLTSDPVLNHASATLREEAMMGAADRGSRALLERFAADEEQVISQYAREYLDELDPA